MGFKKALSGLLIVLLLGFFIYSATTIILSKKDYKEGAEEMAQALNYTEKGTASSDDDPDAPKCAPMSVDFEKLSTMNSEIEGWLYCEDTPINYPVMHTNNNTFYLKHSFAKRKSSIGALFVDSRNRPDFIDGNTIVYGHDMSDGSMMACLVNWQDPEFYENHKSLYLITPEGDYRIDVVSAYETSANSNTFRVIYNTGRDVESYLEKILDRSEFEADMEADPNARYIVFSTYAHRNDSSRQVLHGKLVPLDSVAGKLPSEETEEQ